LIREYEPYTEFEYSSSFIPRLPNRQREIEAIKETLQLHLDNDSVIPWPKISPSLINEYNTEGPLDMAFPTLFPNEVTLPLQARIREVQMHEYALHLMRYHDNRFGRHVRFRYFLYNIIMHHRSQQTTSIFVNKNVEDNIPTAIDNLYQNLHNVPNSQLAKKLMCFGTSLQGMRSYWRKCHYELTNMINQLGSPTIFFMLSFVDTKWPDLHALFSSNNLSPIHYSRKQFT